MPDGQDDVSSSASDVLVTGLAWKHGLEDLARFRALSRKAGGVVHSTVRGASMGSALPTGSRIRIKSGSEDSFRPGDVIAFLAGSRVAAHRIVWQGRAGKAGEFFITQGDGNWLCDPPVHRSAIIGSVEVGGTDGEWLPVGPPDVPRYKQLAARGSQVVMRRLLEASPAAAMRISQAVSWGRMAPRMIFSIARRSIGNVRN